MKRLNWLFVICLVPALVSAEVVLNLANLNYNLLRDPFSLSRFAVKLGVLVAFAWIYSVILGYFLKPRHKD